MREVASPTRTIEHVVDDAVGHALTLAWQLAQAKGPSKPGKGTKKKKASR